MKQGVDESYAPGVRLDEWEDDGSEAFDQLFKRLQENGLARVGSTSLDFCWVSLQYNDVKPYKA